MYLLHHQIDRINHTYMGITKMINHILTHLPLLPLLAALLITANMLK
jgi:hypothetical protein